MRGAALGELGRDGGAMEAAHREEGCGAVVVVFAPGAFGSEGAHDLRFDLPDELHDVSRDAVDRRTRQAAVGPLQQARVSEPDDLDRGLPLARALRGEILRRPRAELLAEPAALVAARQREQRRGVAFRGELHRGTGDAEGFVIGMRVDE